MPAPVTVEVLNGVLKYFKRKNGCTTAELAEGMGVSRATAYQYVRALRDNGVEFDVTPEPTGTRGPPRKRMKVPVDLELVEAPAEPEAEAQA